MSAFPRVIDIKTRMALPEPTLWESASDKQRETAGNKQLLIKIILEKKAEGVSTLPACELLIAEIESGIAPDSICVIAKKLAAGKSIYPGAKTIQRWVSLYKKGGVETLLPKQKGKPRKDYGWEAEAIRLHQQPTQPWYTAVAYWLRQAGLESATDSRVWYYLAHLPETMGRYSRKRMGGHYYDQNMKPYVLRDETVLPVGFIYEGDGHNCDVYIAHPKTGNAWRPELTVWIDIRSHYVVGWWLSKVESGINTLYSLSHALLKHDHVCTGVHVDTGSGFKNRMMTEETSGYLKKLSIEFMPALTGNAKGKGLVEGFFNIFEQRCGKKFETYCGHIRTDRHLSQLMGKVTRGDIKLPSLAQYRDAIEEFIDSYNNNPQDRLGCAPAELWATLEKKPVHITSAALVLPSEKRKVQRWGITIFNRLYRDPELAHYNGRDVVVEYDMHNDNVVTIRDGQRRFICEAQLVERKPWLPASRIEELEQQREQGQIKRHLRDIEEIKHRSKTTIDHGELANQILDDGHTVNAIKQGATLFLDADNKVDVSLDDDDIFSDIDILDTDYHPIDYD